MNILISTDSSCLINKETFKNYNISVFPLNVLIDGIEYLDGVSINQDELFEAMKSDKTIKTSTPPIGVVVNYFEELFAKGYDIILHFTISSKFSSMYSLFNTISSTYFENKIIVIDSYSVSSAMLSQVLLAQEELNNGTEIDEIIKKLDTSKYLYSMYFIPENLNALRKGGRISGAAALIGNTIGLKPVITLNDGQLVKDSMTRNMKITFHEIIDKFINENNFEEYDFTIIEFGGKEVIVDAIKKYLEQKIGENKVIKGSIPVNVCAHCGPGTIGLIISPKINNKSIKDLI